MCKVISLVGLKGRREEECNRLYQQERQEDAFRGAYGMQAFIDAVRALKQQTLSTPQARDMVEFLTRYFSIDPQETEADELLELELTNMRRRTIFIFRKDASEVVSDVKIAVQNARLLREMAVRIISVARFVYSL